VIYYALLILMLFGDLIGKYFLKNGNIYEGKWENGEKYGKGKNKLIYLKIA